MLNLTKGQVLKRKDAQIEQTILIVVEGGALLSLGVTMSQQIVTSSIYERVWYTDEEIVRYFEVPKEEWKPKVDGEYCFINDVGSIDSSDWKEDSIDQKRMNFGNVFRTQEDAQKAADAIKELLKNL